MVLKFDEPEIGQEFLNSIISELDLRPLAGKTIYVLKPGVPIYTLSLQDIVSEPWHLKFQHTGQWKYPLASDNDKALGSIRLKAQDVRAQSSYKVSTLELSADFAAAVKQGITIAESMFDPQNEAELRHVEISEVGIHAIWAAGACNSIFIEIQPDPRGLFGFALYDQVKFDNRVRQAASLILRRPAL